jgi:probable O-glycosylation ligase (exosortase A-associated)
MPIRDITVTAIVLFCLPLILRKPFIGILVWTWLGLMNPHKLCWDFAWGWPFSQLVALTLFASLVINREEQKQIPWSPLTIMLAVFWAWMLFTSFFAFYPELAWDQWGKVWKIMLMTFVTMMLLTTKERIISIVWVMMISIALYGVKGGIFTITTGGGERVLGPYGSFLGGNNEVGLAMIMVVPLIRYIQLTVKNFWLKFLMGIAMALTFVSILGTHSRGALVGLAIMAIYLFLKSRKKLLLLVVMGLSLPAAYTFMPEKWHDRMATIQTYQEDSSAMGRISAWQTAINVALDRPMVGGGFDALGKAGTYVRYSPDFTPGDKTADAHSIYFEILVEHGFAGLFLFLSIGFIAIMTSRSIVKQTRKIPELFWMRDLASMIHVGLIGYAASGAFLGLAYFDFYYTLLAVLASLSLLLKKYQQETTSGEMDAGKLQTDTTPEGEDARPQQGASPAQAGHQIKSRFRKWYDKL